MYKFEYDYKYLCLKCTQSGFWAEQDIDIFFQDLLKNALFYAAKHGMVGMLTDARDFEIQSKQSTDHLNKLFNQQNIKNPFKQAVIISSQLQKMQMKRVLSSMDDVVFLHDMDEAQQWLESLPKSLTHDAHEQG